MSTTWAVQFTDTTLGFNVIASCSSPADEVFGKVNVHTPPDQAVSIFEVTPEDATVWCLARLEPRERRAPGGTTSLLKRLTERADAEGAHLVTEVQPVDEKRTAKIIEILHRFDFESPFEELPAVLRRAPQEVSSSND